LLDDYYDERGWDIPSGIPRITTLKKLNLSDLAEDLKTKGLPP
jgi:hypothetical protein